MENTVSLKDNRLFKRIYARGHSHANYLLVIYFLSNGTSQNKLGITVNKKVGKAVVRNRIRRVIKECYRLKESNIEKGYDIIFVARVKAKDACYHDIDRAMSYLLKKAELM